MKRFLAGLLTAGLVLGAASLALTARQSPPTAPLQITREARNPWTHLQLNNDPVEFQFAFVTDRTGGPRSGVFERAVEQLNHLQPEFVLSVGDLIQGSSQPATLDKQWEEFEGFVRQLEMPFFYVPGNHDVGGKVMAARWKEKFGRTHYEFVYKNVLFLILNTEDGGRRGSEALSDEQLDFARQVLRDNDRVRWTIVIFHKPLWTAANVERTGLPTLERHLGDRPYTVFAGHRHRYERFERNGRRYYMLATTGGGSKLRGLPYGEFDHLVWVTMKRDGPRLANLMVEGVFGDAINTTLRAKSGASAAR